MIEYGHKDYRLGNPNRSISPLYEGPGNRVSEGLTSRFGERMKDMVTTLGSVHMKDITDRQVGLIYQQIVGAQEAMRTCENKMSGHRPYDV